jgi:LPS sulfotransferase NodH
MEPYEDRSPLQLWVEGIAGEVKAIPRVLLPRAPRRFCIFGQGRTGSTLLTTSLDSHPDIRCLDEILRRPRIAPEVHVDLQSRGREIAFGFHLKPYHLTRFQRRQDIGAFLRYLADDGWTLVHLTRRDTVAQAFSVYHARRHGWHHRADDGENAGPLIQVDPEQFVRKVQKRREWLVREYEALKGLDVFSVCYEEHLLRPGPREARLRALLHHLGLPEAPLQSPLKKSVRGSPWDLMANPDEVRGALRRAGISAN